MLAHLSEQRGRKKLRRRKRDNANPETELECFQVTVNILEARNLVWSNTYTSNFYVLVMLGKKKYRTNMRKKMDEQYCKECLVFEWYTTLREVQQSSLSMAVMEPRCCARPRLLGKANIDLGVIWVQPNHQVFHKWVQLTLPRNPGAGTVGFLKVDVSVMCRGDVQVKPITVFSEKLTENLLPSTFEQQTADYLISIYNAFDVTWRPQEQYGRRQQKLPSTYVKVNFCGISARTAVQVRTNIQSYCEQISITEVFPNICPTVRFEICSTVHYRNPILASVDLNLGQISYDEENGFVPTFGPSLLHMYGNCKSGIETPGGEGPFYRGALLVALKTIIPCLQQDTRITNVEPIAPIPMENLWAWEDYCIYCPVLEVSMLERRLIGTSCGVALTIGEIACERSNNEAFLLKKQEIKKEKLHYTGPIDITKSTDQYGYLNFANAFPVLQQATRLPGFRFRIYRNNLVQRIAEQLENSLRDVENNLSNTEYSNPCESLDDIIHAVDVAAEDINKFFEVVHHLDPSAKNHCYMNRYSTELDQKQMALQKEELEKVYHQMREKINLSSTVNLKKLIGKNSKDCCSITKKNVKTLLAESITFAQKLKSLVFKTAQGWPDIVLWLLSQGSRFAFHKICTPDVVFSEIPELIGKDCGRIQTVYMKPLKCPKHLNIVPSACTCIVGKIELLMWMGLHSDVSFLNTCLPQEFTFKTYDYDMCIKAPIMMVKCRVFIYRAKLTIFENMSPPCPFVRINVLNLVKETQVQEATLMPIWDQVLTVNCMTRISQDRIATSPPEIMVEVYHKDLLGMTELIGRSKIQPTVGDKLNVEYAPKLKWHDLSNGTENTGQILMSALIQQVPETLVKSTKYSSITETNATHTQDVLQLENEDIEELPQSLKPKPKFYKVDVYWWGLRDVSVTKKPCAVLEIDELIIKSDVIAEKKSNCNFSNGRISQTFVGSLDNPLTVKLYDSSTFGRIIFLGTKAVKNPTKYIVDWLPKSEREASLRSVSFSSSNFFRVNKMLFIKKSKTRSESTTECSKITISSSMVDDKKWSTWKKLFCITQPDEEESMLLPMHVTEKDQNQLERNKSETEDQDWWSRFFSSQKPVDECVDSNGKIKIYDSELEHQPEYDKFRDWCSSMKLYNGKKTGLPEKDEEMRGGIVKVGIAIYRWPPPPDTVAVACNGVELQRGFFEDFPCNDSSKFVVRIYIVRGLNLTPKDFNGKCDPYVVIKCGAKQYGDRSQFLQNTVNPIFGRTYECRCSLPEDYLMTVSMYDHDTMGHDVLIGSTSIDLEDRIYSKHRGRVGLSSEYKVTGTAKWRDCEKPSEILAKVCTKNHMRPPVFPNGNTVVVNGIEYRDADKSNKTYISASERKENICLDLLHKWHSLPLCGYHLVPEHVETRTLLNPETPGVDQGKVLMWLDIFPLESGACMPLPVDITPRKVEDYELRVIIWHVQSLRQDCINTKKGLDLYVKAWIGNMEQAHYTDIHYNSMNGDACFNWRMIFKFQYQHSDKLILMEKGLFTESEERLPPILVVQVADSDADSIDDYLATLALDLSAVPRGSKQIQRGNLEKLENTKKINLFSSRSIRSWWPLKSVDKKTGIVKFKGMIDLELHLLPKDKAIIMPVGFGRDPPFPLPTPNRTDSRKLKSSVWESISNPGSAEYLVVGLLMVMLFVAFYWELPISVGNFIFYH